MEMELQSGWSIAKTTQTDLVSDKPESSSGEESVETKVLISPSHFQPLANIDEDEEEEPLDMEDVLEDGEIQNTGLSKNRKHNSQPKTAKKSARQQIGRSRDLKLLSMKGAPKQFSVRKI